MGKFKIHNFVKFTEGDHKGKYGTIWACSTDGYTVACNGSVIDGIKESDIELADGEVYAAFVDMLMFQNLIVHLNDEEAEQAFIEDIALMYEAKRYSKEAISAALSLLKPVTLSNGGTDGNINYHISALENVNISLLNE